MADETPEPIHPLDAGLRAQAAKRRAELGAVEPEMPGPMRAQLQSEYRVSVAGRRDRAAESPGFLAWFFQWQRALATVGVTPSAHRPLRLERRLVRGAPQTVAKQAAPSEAPPRRRIPSR